GLVESYQMEDAEHAIVAMGSVVSTARILVDRMRAEGKKIGLVKVRVWRPFPSKELCNILKNTKNITVLDKNIVFGVGGALATELKSALYSKGDMAISGYIVGLGGRKCDIEEIEQAVNSTEESNEKNRSEWIGF
ncbi:MAG: transketolase C-terminal domain-containing protein, partial [Eubacteriales bacterium]